MHPHIALLAMGFLPAHVWLVRGGTSGVFGDRPYRFAGRNTLWGWIAVVLSTAAGARP